MQHGHATYIKTPNNRHIAIGTGDYAGGNQASSPLQHYGVNQLDYVVITHQRVLEEVCGIRQPMISRIESGETDPQLGTILKILRPPGKTLAVVDAPAATPTRMPEARYVWLYLLLSSGNK